MKIICETHHLTRPAPTRDGYDVPPQILPQLTDYFEKRVVAG